MEIKDFLKQKNYSDLLPELEKNFTITPKVVEWSITKGIYRKVGSYWIVVGKSLKDIWVGSGPAGQYCWITVLGGNNNNNPLFSTRVDGIFIGHKNTIMGNFQSEARKYLGVTDTHNASDYEEVWEKIVEAFGAN